MAANPQPSRRVRTITTALDEDLVRRANACDIFEPVSIANVIERELERRERIARAFDAFDRLPPDVNPPMTRDEIQAEVNAVRQERRKPGSRAPLTRSAAPLP